LEKTHLDYTRSFAQDQGKGMIPVLLMYLCRLSIIWKAEILFLGGHLPMNERSILPKIKGDREVENEDITNGSVRLITPHVVRLASKAPAELDFDATGGYNSEAGRGVRVV